MGQMSSERTTEKSPEILSWDKNAYTEVGVSEGEGKAKSLIWQQWMDLRDKNPV